MKTGNKIEQVWIPVSQGSNFEVHLISQSS